MEYYDGFEYHLQDFAQSFDSHEYGDYDYDATNDLHVCVNLYVYNFGSRFDYGRSLNHFDRVFYFD
jgi:hypothetical protein